MTVPTRHEFSGAFYAHWETGMGWVEARFQDAAFVDPISGQASMEGMSTVEEGDELTCFDPQGRCVWQGVVRFRWWSREPALPVGWRDRFDQQYRGRLRKSGKPGQALCLR